MDGPKAFVQIAGRSLLARAVDIVDACPEVEGLVVAAPPAEQDRATATARSSAKLLGVVPGGDTRRASIAAALEAVPEGFDAVVCHDVARPLASPGLFRAVLEALAHADGAVPVVAVADTVKRVANGSVVETVSREGLALAQTPQAFRRSCLAAAHAAAVDGASATDDAVLLELAGYSVAVVPGEATNVKVTTPEDLRLAEALLS